MADKPKDKGGKKPSAPPPAPNATNTIVGILVALFCVMFFLGVLQNRFAGGGQFKPDTWVRSVLFTFSSKVDEYTPEGVRVNTKEGVDVWASSILDRILGIHEKGAVGVLISKPVLYGSDVLFNVDFESNPDGWVYARSLEKQVSGWMGSVRSIFLWVSGSVTLLGLLLALYSWRKWQHIIKKHKEDMRALEKKLVGEDITSHNERWEQVEKLTASENPGDWRIAIIEADVLLEELLISMGYDGQTLGDRLKAIEKSDFTTLDEAWEAHKIRNRIAHQGSDFILTHREVKRVIDLFRTVFREFDYI
ncbi:MAG: hypothetical protein NUW02_02795 [Candidatus Campbellbacteria bacterium]|nr:hypothetical protein [Candidatus Campbellbacteria bacterium]